MKRRSLLRSILVPAAVGLLSVGVAWAGAGLVPVPVQPDDLAVDDDVAVDADATDDELPPLEAPAARQQSGPETAPFLPPGDVALPATSLEQGWYHVGTGKVNLYPRPDDYGGFWNRDMGECTTLDQDLFTNIAPEHTGDHEGHDHNDHVVTSSPWPENPDCLYMGGFGLGPANPIREFSDGELTEKELADGRGGDGLFVRTVAISSGRDDDGDRATDALFLTVVDAEGWLWDYASKACTGTRFEDENGTETTRQPDGCGWKQIQARLASELGVSESAFISHATHSHAAMDFLGGWGFVPDWYMQQAVDSIEESVRRAIAAMEPARLEVGEVLARNHNSERRDTYRAPEDPTISFLRAYVPGETVVVDDGKGNGKGDAPNQQPTTETTPPRTIATIGVYAAHPTTRGTNQGIAHADWPGRFAESAEDRFGGMAMHMMSGLGNMSASGGTAIGERLAGLLPAVGAGEDLRTTSIASTERVWAQPTTNVPLTALGLPGFFDRAFLTEPASLSVGESSSSPCTSASPFSVEIVARAARIGDRVAVTSGPGEMFSNSTNTIEEQASRRHGAFALAVAQANDSLGYLPESFELSPNPLAGQGAGFFAGGQAYVNYEDSYAIDRCFGDANLEYTLGLLDQLFG